MKSESFKITILKSIGILSAGITLAIILLIAS